MREEKIVLPDFIIAGLYKNHLVEPIQEIENVTEKQVINQPKVEYLGENKKRVIVLVSEENARFINDNELAFLTKILSACNLTLADIAVINTTRNNVDFTTLLNELNAEYILMLGVQPASIDLPFAIPNFQVQKFSNCTIISSPALAQMQSDSAESKALKRQLWTALQKAFNLS